MCTNIFLYLRDVVLRRSAAKNHTDERVKNVVHRYATTCYVAEPGMQFPTYIAIRRTGAWICARHPAIANGREEHSHHGDEQSRDDMASGYRAHYAKYRHSSCRLDHDDSVNHQMPKGDG